MAGRFTGLLKQLGDARQGFRDDLGIGPEDVRKAHYRELEIDGKQPDAPKMDQMIGAWHLGNKVQEAAGRARPARVQAEREMDLGLKSDQTPAYRAGQMGAAVANDIAQDGLRKFYWLLNAAQASAEVINEKVQKDFNRMAHGDGPLNLYGQHPVMNANVPNEPLRVANKNQALEQGVIKIVDGKTIPRRGVSIVGKGKDAQYQERNFESGHLPWLSVPTGIAINTGLGLMTPFGGAEGYKAALPSEEDPSKTDNILGEIALKYFMGRTGNLLPYDEFVKVRPDVSKDEYNRYQAFKYDKNVDLNPMDGDITLPGGVIKTTDEGIHGPELQFLGRSLPVTTGVTPFVSALAGGAAGVASKRPLKGGIVGGLVGLAAGQIGGNLIEGERRRRNKEENERQY